MQAFITCCPCLCLLMHVSQPSCLQEEGVWFASSASVMHGHSEGLICKDDGSNLLGNTCRPEGKILRLNAFFIMSSYTP